jgi:hypothetical protein
MPGLNECDVDATAMQILHRPENFLQASACLQAGACLKASACLEASV